MSYKAALSPHFLFTSEDGSQVYNGEVSGTWCIGVVPHGGYVLSLILAVAIDSQHHTSHPHVIHVTAHFLQSVTVSEYEIQVRRVRQGKRLSNLEADLLQGGEIKITSKLVFGILPDITQVSPSDTLTLSPFIPISRRIPLRLHPSKATPAEPNPKIRFDVTLADDPYFYARNKAKTDLAYSASSAASATLPNGDVVERDGVFEWGSWCELADKTDVMDASMIPFFSDLQKNLPELLPERQRPGPTWYATVVLSIEFKSKIPSFESGLFSPRTVGLYSSGRFLSEGRHESYVEVWTSPGTVGGKGHTNTPRWQEQQVCLAIAQQMALSIPLEKNLRKGAAPSPEKSRL